MSARPYRYEVQRDVWDAGRTDVSLVRQAPPAPHRLSLRHAPHSEPVVLFHRTFRPLLELKELERYAGQLELVARHANAGTLGCFVDTRPHDGVVDVALYDRWFDGESLRCDELARRRFDAGDERALVASAEFVAELQQWSERRNEERELTYATDVRRPMPASATPVTPRPPPASWPPSCAATRVPRADRTGRRPGLPIRAARPCRARRARRQILEC